jgi:hypothetical protein
LFATDDIEQGEVIIRIPGHCLLNLVTLAPLQAQFPLYDDLCSTPDGQDQGIERPSTIDDIPDI